MKNTVSEMKNTIERTNRLDKAEKWITDLEDKVEKTPNQNSKKKQD